MTILLISDREQLVAALRERGIDWLAPGDAQGEPVSDETLIASLAAHEDPRLRQALIGLFLLHPQLATFAQRLYPKLKPETKKELAAHYMAAVYLRQMWRTRLQHYLPSLPELPDYFSKKMRLPSPEIGYGKHGLYTLAERHSRFSARRANHLAEYQNVADLLFDQLKRKSRHHVLALTR